MDNNEIFKQIEGYTNYKVSNLGYIINKKNKILKTCISNKGYLMVQLYENNKRRIFNLHKIIADTFLMKENNNDEIDHINGNKKDNRIENLRYCSRSENLKNRKIFYKKTSTEHHILKNKKSFTVLIRHNKCNHRSTHKDLNEAINKRDELINNINK